MVEVVEMKSSSESVNDLEAVLKSFLEDKCDCDILFGDILVAMMEAVNNAIKHGNKYDLSKKVRIQMHSNPYKVQFAVSDEGEGFDIEDNSPNPLGRNLRDCNGRGIFLMKSLSDDFCYQNKGNTVVMDFHLNN